jgi:hypothetical protein
VVAVLLTAPAAFAPKWGSNKSPDKFVPPVMTSARQAVLKRRGGGSMGGSKKSA